MIYFRPSGHFKLQFGHRFSTVVHPEKNAAHTLDLICNKADHKWKRFFRLRLDTLKEVN